MSIRNNGMSLRPETYIQIFLALVITISVGYGLHRLTHNDPTPIIVNKISNAVQEAPIQPLPLSSKDVDGEVKNAPQVGQGIYISAEEHDDLQAINEDLGFS